MVAPAVAPYVPTYATETPYITVAEFLAEPTGVDTTQLVPGGTTVEQQAALARVIARASSQADNLCRKLIAATVDVQSGEYRIRRDGTIWVPANYAPVVQVNAVSLGYAQGAMVPLTDLSGVRPERKLIKIPACGVTATWVSTPRTPARRGWIYADVTYVNGYAVTTSSGAVLAGASALPLVGVLGVVPGLPLVVSDGASTESVAVDSSYVIGSSSVPLTAPLQFAHAKGVAVSAVPGAVKDAVILLTASRIKTRGAEAVQMGSISAEPGPPQATMPGGTTEYNQAVELLKRLRRAR